MWYSTKAAKLLGVEYPILQGSFGGNLSTVQLTTTVSNAGGVGDFGAYTLKPEEIVQVDKQIRQSTDKPYNINLWVSDTDVAGDVATEAAMEKVRALYRPYFSMSSHRCLVLLGIPSAQILEECRRRGILT